MKDIISFGNHMLFKNCFVLIFCWLQNELTGEAPLHYAARKQNEEMLKSLLDRNADVRAQTTDGDTPLHFIRSADERSLALLLLEKGADIYVKNNAEESPHDLADKTVDIYLLSPMSIFSVISLIPLSIIPYWCILASF